MVLPVTKPRLPDELQQFVEAEMSVLPDRAKKDDTRLKVLLVDDHIRVLASAQRLLGSRYRVVAAAHDGMATLAAAEVFTPDLVLLDIEMPAMDGIHLAQEMRRLGLTARILFLTVHEDEDYLAAARACGNGYVLKSRMSSDLQHAIDEAFSGRFFVSHRTM